MKRDAIIARLKEAEAESKARGVIHAALFGSVARGEEGPDSDIDVMVELDPETHQRMDLFEYIGIVHVIEDMFPTRVDVSNRVAMKEHVRPTAERDVVYAFEEKPRAFRNSRQHPFRSAVYRIYKNDAGLQH